MIPSIYLCGKEVATQLNLTSQKVHLGHGQNIKYGIKFFWPEKFHKTCVSPKTFISLKKEIKTKEILIIDRVFVSNKFIIISDHINRSGKNFLRKNTPHKDGPTFPDITQIYSNNNKETVTTVGPDKFEKHLFFGTNRVSEKIAPISIVWIYVGMKIQAIGLGDKINNVPQLIKELENFR